jgi:hypothetical protein
MSSIENFNFGPKLADGSGEDPTVVRRRKMSGYEHHRQQVFKSKKRSRDYERDLTPPLLGLAVGDFLSALVGTCEQITKKFKSKFESANNMNAELSLLLLTITALYLREHLPNDTSDYRDVLDERISNALSMGSSDALVKILTSRLPGSIEKLMSLGLPPKPGKPVEIEETSDQAD